MAKGEILEKLVSYLEEKGYEYYFNLDYPTREISPYDKYKSPTLELITGILADWVDAEGFDETRLNIQLANDITKVSYESNDPELKYIARNSFSHFREYKNFILHDEMNKAFNNF